MKAQNSLRKYGLFISIQLFISIGYIVLFQQIFGLRPVVIIGHLFVVICGHILILLSAILLFSQRFIRYKTITKYLVSLSYCIFSVTLYYSYLLAFSGEHFNSRIFNFEIALGYLKYLNEIVSNFSLSPLLVYSVLFIIPLCIFASIIWITSLIYGGILEIKNSIFSFSYNSLTNKGKVYSGLIIFLITLIIGTSIILLQKEPLSNRLLRIKEPFISVYFDNSNPFNGQLVSNNNEDIGIRNKYPKDIIFQKKNVILIVVDALRSDHMSLFGYERKTTSFLDSLYKAGDLKKVALSLSVAGESFAGINGILRSKILANMGYNNFALPQLFKDQGYQLNFIISGDHTNFYGLKSFYGKNSEFDYYIDGSETIKYSDPNDDRIIFEGLEKIEHYHGDASYFHFHLMSTHNLGVHLDEYKTFEPAARKGLKFDNYLNRYDNGILQTDAYIERIFRELDTKCYLQNSIVVLTSDHGEALGERGKYGHGKNIYTDQLLVPILIYDSDTVQYKNMDYATTLDIAPTIIDRLELPVPESWEGSSLLSKSPRAYTYHQKDEYYAVVHTTDEQQTKYIYNNRTQEEELYNLTADLYETNNLISTADVGYVDSLKNQLTQFGIEVK